MRKILSFKHLTSLCFLILLGSLLLSSVTLFIDIALRQFERWQAGESVSFSQMKQEYMDNLPGKATFVTINGGFQRLMGIRQINERYLQDNGHLTYVNEAMDPTACAEDTVAFRDALEEMGIPFAYIGTAFKVDPEDKQLPVGVTDHTNENADRLYEILEENGVQLLDLRRSIKEQGLDHYSLFFRTDHHWTPEAGFWAYTQVADWLTSLDSSFAVDPAITREESYSHTVYEKIFCGSAARRVGPLYAGLDDLTVIVPEFDTDLRFGVPGDGTQRQGTYEETVLFRENLTRKDMMEHSAYSVYMGSDMAKLQVVNNSRQQGLEVQSTPKKLLIIKDSMALVVAPYLALSYDEVQLVDLRLLQEDLLSYVEAYQPDMVLVMYNPGAVDESNRDMFQFLK